MTQASAGAEARTNRTEPTNPPFKHLFHKCDRDQPTRTAYCGLKVDNVGMRPFEGGRNTPDMCVVCMDFHGKVCPRCGD